MSIPEPLPGTHQIEPQEIVARNWTEFRRAVTQLRKRFPIVPRNKVYRDHDRRAFRTDMPVIYELVFRGQTKEYIQQFPPMAPMSYVTMMSEESAGDLTSIWL